MRTCPKCTTELVIDGGERCPVCNALLTTVAQANATSSDDDTPFEVTEAHDDQRELIGGGARKSRQDELGIEDDASITSRQAGAEGAANAPQRRQSLDDEQVSAPLIVTPLAGKAVSSAKPTEEKSGITRLSAKEIESISKNMYSSGSYMSERDKRELLKKADNASASSSQHLSSHAELDDHSDADPTRPRMAKRVRGMAYYYRNWIQVIGENNLHDMDEVVINDRPYLLRKKKFSPKFVLATLSPVIAVVLFFIGSALTPSISGKGRLVGVVTDSNGQPLTHPASIRLPDIGQTITSNGQGFFVSDPIKSGSHKIEYLVEGATVASDFATIVDGDITTIRLAPTLAKSPVNSGSPVVNEVRSQVPATQDEQAVVERQVPTRVAAPRQQERDRGDDQATADPSARLMLDADVEGATLSLNDRVVGAGNMTYARLKPGHYDYEVSREGYKSVKGTVDLTGGKTTSLSVRLTAQPQKSTPSKPSVSPEEQHYETALAALKNGDYTAAESELTAAIDARPGYAAAITQLAEIKSKTGRGIEASADFLRAAEIYRVNGNLGNALTAYNGAVRTDKSSTAALIGRGNLYLSRGEEIAAIADYEQVISLDRRNVQAYFGLGRSRFSQGNPKQAIKHFKDARSLDPKDADVHEYLMLCYFGVDDIKEAKKSYEDFVSVANDAQLKQVKSNPKFGAVLRVVEER